MKNRQHQVGSTLVEVLVSFAILATTGVFMVGFLFKNPMSNKAWVDNYGFELSKVTLLTAAIDSNATFAHTDANGFRWKTIVTATKDSTETCFRAISVRNKVDSTRALNYCTYREEK